MNWLNLVNTGWHQLPQMCARRLFVQFAAIQITGKKTSIQYSGDYNAVYYYSMDFPICQYFFSIFYVFLLNKRRLIGRFAHPREKSAKTDLLCIGDARFGMKCGTSGRIYKACKKIFFGKFKKTLAFPFGIW